MIERRTAALILVAAVAGFLVLTALVLGFGVTGWDSALLRALHAMQSGELTGIMRAVTTLGSLAVLAPLTSAIVILLIVLRRPRAALFVGSCLAGADLLQFALKAVFGRPRPALFPPLAHAANASYPSGHAMVSAAFALALGCLFWGTRWRWTVAIVGALYVMAVSFSRVYLGVHYPSDVLAGWLLSIAWVMLLELAVPMSRSRRPRRPQGRSSAPA